MSKKQKAFQAGVLVMLSQIIVIIAPDTGIKGLLAISVTAFVLLGYLFLGDEE